MSAETATGGLLDTFNTAITSQAAVNLTFGLVGVVAIYLVAREGLERIGVLDKK